MELLIISLVFMGLGWLVQRRLRSKFDYYSQIHLTKDITGQQAAERMLIDNGIRDVKVISVDGQLTDHYNPSDRTVNLSHNVYHGRNAAAVAVAAHECGHAVQHARAYSMLGLRSVMVPITNISAKVLNVLMMVMMFGGLAVLGTGAAPILVTVMVACNLVLTLFAAITLPVEFDASKRALAWLSTSGVVNSQEHEMAKDALWWAAMTYVVAALGALAQLLYWVAMLLGMNRDDD